MSASYTFVWAMVPDCHTWIDVGRASAIFWLALNTQARGRLERILIQHPALWALAGGILFAVWGGLMPRIRWNAIEMMIARNMLLGRGFVVAPLDPPALWRPPLGVFLCAAVELFNTDPFVIYRLIYAVALTTFLITSFYAAKALWDTTAAHVACLFILTTGAMTARLVIHIHGISHIAFLLVIGPALMCTVKAYLSPTPARMFWAGCFWGLCYLARWETLLFFVVTAGFAISARAPSQRARLARVMFLGLGFGLWFTPYTLYQSWARARYGIWGPSAITTFYASEAWVSGSGDEDAGFAAAERVYGTLESNHFSLLRAIARNPAGLRARLSVNIPRFLNLFTDREFFDPVWLLLAAGLGFDLALARKRLMPLVWLALLILCSTSVCLFQIDSRYLTISLPVILLILCGGVTCFANAVERIFGRGKRTAAVVCILFLALRCGGASHRQLIALEANPVRRLGIRSVEFAREISRHFRQVAPGDQPAVLMVRPDPSLEMNQTDMFLVSYFAGTALTWTQPTSYPRDKIFSEVHKELDYVYLPQGTDIASAPVAEWRSLWGSYDLLRTR